MRTCRLSTLAWALLVLPAALGCNPDHRLLHSKCGADGGGDCGPECAMSEECGDSAACVDEVCVGCSELLKSCESCPPGFQLSKYMEPPCSACRCLRECRWHDDCDLGTVCSAGACTDCADVVNVDCAGTCNWGFEPIRVARNGCMVCECAPRNECWQDSDCGAGRTCYAGQQCLEACHEPKCCYGNICGEPGCKPPVAAECVYVGCDRGVCRGDPMCPLGGCKCVPGAAEEWSCSDSCGAVCSFP